MIEQLTSRIPCSGWIRRAQAPTEDAEDRAPAAGFAEERSHPESPREAASAGGPTSSDVHGAQPAEDLWDPDTWSGPERTLLTIVALVAPFVLWFYVVDRLPEAWVDWAAIPIFGVGDLIAAVLFVFVYGSVRALLRLLMNRSSNPPQVGRHRR
jgi:hypothetical protein